MNETTKKMLAELDDAIMECFWIPNEHLPEEFHDDREGGRTLKRLNRQVKESVVDVERVISHVSNMGIWVSSKSLAKYLN